MLLVTPTFSLRIFRRLPFELRVSQCINKRNIAAQTMTAGSNVPLIKYSVTRFSMLRLNVSVRRRGKNVDTSSKSNPLRRRAWKKITTRRREGVGVVVEKNEESRRTFNKTSCDLLTAIRHTEILCA